MSANIEVSVGDVYGKLTIESELPPRERKGGGTERWFRCVCECGVERDFLLHRLRSGKTRSCGCLRKVAKPVGVGDRYGRLTILREVESVRFPNGTLSRIVECRCECGTENTYRFYSLKNGSTKSCGCLKLDLLSEDGRNVKHGGVGSREYVTWQAMKSRCTNPSNNSWSHYGGRGIEICDRWTSSFEAFLEDMGRRPGVGYSIDRIDNDGNYSCGHCDECLEKGWEKNCRWATSEEQSRNRSNTVYVEHDGANVLLSELAKELDKTCDIPLRIITKRLRSGESAEEAVRPRIDKRAVKFNGEEAVFSEWAFRFGLSPEQLKRRLKTGLSFGEALTIRNDGDSFYQTPLEDRDVEWYREYERRELLERVEDWARTFDVDKDDLLNAYLSSDKPTINGKFCESIKALGVVTTGK